jgi:ABC-2 type transport system permease protein
MSSISLEGKNLWIIKSLPVEPKIIFKSKLAVNLIITAPALLDALIIAVILKTNFLQTFFIVIVTAVFALFVSLFGLLVNLKFPNFNWNTEVVVIKQSAATMIALFTGMGAAGLLAVCLIAIPSVNVGYSIFIGLMIVVDLVLYRIIMNWGSKQFARLS